LGAGMKATQVLFPDSGLTGAIGRLSLPIALASFAMSGFKKLYEKETQRSSALLSTSYKDLGTVFASQLNETAGNFGISAYGMPAYNAVRDIARKRAKDFDTTNELGSYIYNVVTDSQYGIMLDNVAEIEKRTREGYGEICERIYQVYQGTRHAPGHNLLIRLDPFETVDYIDILTRAKLPRELYNPLCQCRVTKGPKRHLVNMGSGLDDEVLASILSEIWRMEVEYVDNFIFDDVVYVWPINDPPKINALAADYARGAVGDVHNRLMQADAKIWGNWEQIKQRARA